MAAGIEVPEALSRNDLIFIDVRSPAEFARESIPEAINIPLFPDDQHRRLGIIYNTEGQMAARREGFKFISPRLPEIVENICDAAGVKIPLLYCWRGGMRSLTLFWILDMLKIPVLRLKGGYRAYRKHVYQALCGYQIKPPLVVLNGLTGVGKTAIINQLLLQGYPAIDLEGLAHHRGSVFGAVGFSGQRSQKDFESLLLIELNKYREFPYLVLEGEGSRIGPLHLPRFLTRAMMEGIHVLVNAPLDLRAERILQEYLYPGISVKYLNQIEQGLTSLEHRLGKIKTARLLSLFHEGNYLPVVREICTGYYDRLYKDAKPEHRKFAAVLESSQIIQATAQLIEFLNHRYHNPCLSQKEDVHT